MTLGDAAAGPRVLYRVVPRFRHRVEPETGRGHGIYPGQPSIGRPITCRRGPAVTITFTRVGQFRAGL
jgi:hypothetical protein